MDNENGKCYTIGTKFQLLEVGKLTKTIMEVQNLKVQNPLLEKFDKLTRDKEANEVIELFERDFAFKFGASGTYLSDLFKEGN